MVRHTHTHSMYGEMVGHYDLINRDNTRVIKEFVLLVLHKLHTSLLTMINLFFLRA